MLIASFSKVMIIESYLFPLEIIEALLLLLTLTSNEFFRFDFLRLFLLFLIRILMYFIISRICLNSRGRSLSKASIWLVMVNSLSDNF